MGKSKAKSVLGNWNIYIIYSLLWDKKKVKCKMSVNVERIIVRTMQASVDDHNVAYVTMLDAQIGWEINTISLDVLHSSNHMYVTIIFLVSLRHSG